LSEFTNNPSQTLVGMTIEAIDVDLAFVPPCRYSRFRLKIGDSFCGQLHQSAACLLETNPQPRLHDLGFLQAGRFSKRSFVGFVAIVRLNNLVDPGTSFQTAYAPRLPGR
jgi:hypothetical protein